jgi:hypothetical protein
MQQNGVDDRLRAEPVMSNTETWRSALKGGKVDTTTSSNAQHDQLNQSDTEEQHRKRTVVESVNTGTSFKVKG